MKRKLLYYPYIDIPNLSFVKKVILYWDKISSIVPSDYEYKFDLNPHIKYLEDEGEYEPVFTNNLYFHCGLWEDVENVKENFKKELIKTLTSLKKRKSKKIVRLHKEKVREYKIHKNKIIGFENEIYEFLKANRFLLYEDREWMYLPEDIADIIMSILAKYLAICDKDYTIPATDKERYEKICFKIKTTKNISSKTIALNFFLKKLPTPKDSVSLQDIIHFKRKRYDELIEFRKFFLSFVNKFQQVEAIEEIKEILINFEESFNKKKREIEKMFKDSRIDFEFTTVKTLIPLIFIENLIDKLFTYIGSFLVQIGVNFMEIFIKSKKQIEKNELAYLYYAKKEGILNL